MEDIRPPPQTSSEKLCATLQNVDRLLKDGELEVGNKYNIISYCPPELLSSVFSRTTFYAHILHNEDINADGSLVEPHYHYILQFAKNKDPLQLCKEFHADEFTFRIQNLISKDASLRYLTHSDDPTKKQYPVANVHSSSMLQVERAHRTFVSKEDNSDELMQDLYRLDPFALGRKYGRDFIKNIQQYANFIRYTAQIYQPIETDDELYDRSISFASLVMKGCYTK